MDTSTVTVGTRVVAGQQIGTVGDKGSPGDEHLHIQIRKMREL